MEKRRSLCVLSTDEKAIAYALEVQKNIVYTFAGCVYTYTHTHTYTSMFCYFIIRIDSLHERIRFIILEWIEEEEGEEKSR